MNMARLNQPRIKNAELAFDAISIEGGLLAADWLARIARLDAAHQGPVDYGVQKGLELRDEIGRYWRIARAYWKDFEAGLNAKADPEELARRFVSALFREVYGYHDLVECHRGQDLAAPLLEQIVRDGREWPITAIDAAGRLPIVCAPAGAGLDTPMRIFGDDHRRRTAFGLTQEFLNATDSALWGLCADGLTLRLLRDNASLTRPAWIEIDLARIFSEELYPDFAVTWLLLHRSRFGRDGQDPASCILEIWRSTAREEGTRARDRLRAGFEEALLILGRGFLAHPSNQPLRRLLYDGSLSRRDYFGELLRLVYRLIFLLTIEERDLLHPKDTPTQVKERYKAGYGLQRLRDRAARRTAHDRHGDLWEALKIVWRGLGSGEPQLGLPALAGLFAPGHCPNLDVASLDNRSLLGALFQLCWLREANGIARVNWRDMGPDELGYIYEGLLELVPQVTHDGRDFTFAGREESRGNARKTSGSYYTPDNLVVILLENALDPVISQTIARHPGREVESLLELSIVDPACGSGHFLLAAARRLAEQVARLQVSGTPTPEDYRHALRQVVGLCIYGVDLNPLAVELCKVALWMEAIDPGLPLTFLDAHIRHGNALLGASSRLMAEGVPENAWEPLAGDDRKIASSLKRRNKSELSGQELLPLAPASEFEEIRLAIEEFEQTPDTTATALAEKERRWTELLASDSWRHKKLIYDAWSAAFVWPKQQVGPLTEIAPTTAAWRALRDGRHSPPRLLVETTDALASDYRFFHWELAFPRVFDRGGFDVVLGNPPWERVKLQEQEFFASRNNEIARARNAAERKKLIAQLPLTNTELWEEWNRETRLAQGTSQFVRNSGRYPLCGKKDVNTYALFAEHIWQVLGPRGRAGFIVPSGIATDDTTKEYFRAVMQNRSLSSMWEFENEGFFTAGKGHMLRFALTTLVGRDQPFTTTDFMFQGQSIMDLEDPQRHFTLTSDDIDTVNPNTGTCPIFRTQRDAAIALKIYQRTGILWREGDPDGNPWGIRFLRMLDMANDSALFRRGAELLSSGWTLSGNHFVKDGQVMLPLYEAKMAHIYNHRSGVYDLSSAGERLHRLPTPSDEQLSDPDFVSTPYYWVLKDEVTARLDGVWDRQWLLGWRDVTDARASVRTVVSAVIPMAAVNHKFLLLMPSISTALLTCLSANLASLVFDYCARQKVGGLSLNYYTMRQLPAIKPCSYDKPARWLESQTIVEWMLPRILELTYTAWDLRPFALDCGDDGPPFIWDASRRFQLQCELDAAFFHLYQISREDTEYILTTFDVLERAEIRQHGEFRTRRVVLERYDDLASASASGRPYISPLGPARRAQ